MADQGIRTVRIMWPDQDGALRGKFVSARAFGLSFRNGMDFSGALLSMDSANHVFPPVRGGGGLGIPELTGFPDVVLLPDATTFGVLPWVEATAWVVWDMYFGNGIEVTLSTHSVMRRQLQAAAEMRFDYVAGWRWRSTSGGAHGTGSLPTRPGGRRWRPRSAWSPRATSTYPRPGWRSWLTSSTPCGAT